MHLQALARNGILLGSYPLRVLPSKTAIVPVNNQYLPKTSEERELCGRTVYAANIDKKVDRTDVQAFFESLCGEPISVPRVCDSQQWKAFHIGFHFIAFLTTVLDGSPLFQRIPRSLQRC